MRELKQASDPHIRVIVWVRGETFKAESETADLWQPKWNENQIVLAAAIHTPGRCSSWELQFRHCGAIPGWGLLLIAERQIKGIGGRRSWWEMPVEESRAAMEARGYCWVTHSGWSHHHILSVPTGRHGHLNNREAGPLNTWSSWTREEDPTQGAPLSPWHADLQSRTPVRAAPLCIWCAE